MRGVLFLTFIALCTLTEEASAVAATGRAGKSSSRRGRTRGAPRGGTGRPDAPPPRRRRDEAVLHSDDGEPVSWEEEPAVVIGAVRPEGGREQQQQYQTRRGRGDEDDDDDFDRDIEQDDGDDGGNGSGYDDWGDEDFSEEAGLSEETEEEEEEEEEHYRTRNGRKTRAPAATSHRGARATANRRAYYDDTEGGRARRGRGAGASPSGTKKGKSGGGGVVKSVGKATGKSMKAMVHALQPKSVGLGEILDAWKIEQIIGKPPGRVTKCAATVEFRRDGTVATSFDGQESVSDFTFRAHAWPRACTIEFEAKAFQGPWDEEPVWKVYKGSFSRKLLDPKIITLEGTIYDVTGKMMWKRRVKSGKFTARRRPSRPARASSRGGGGGGSPTYGKKKARRRTDFDEVEAEEEGGWGGGGASSKRDERGSSGSSGEGKKRKRRRTGSSRAIGGGSRTGGRDEL